MFVVFVRLNHRHTVSATSVAECVEAISFGSHAGLADYSQEVAFGLVETCCLLDALLPASCKKDT